MVDGASIDSFGRFFFFNSTFFNTIYFDVLGLNLSSSHWRGFWVVWAGSEPLALIWRRRRSSYALNWSWFLLFVFGLFTFCWNFLKWILRVEFLAFQVFLVEARFAVWTAALRDGPVFDAILMENMSACDDLAHFSLWTELLQAKSASFTFVFWLDLRVNSPNDVLVKVVFVQIVNKSVRLVQWLVEDPRSDSDLTNSFVFQDYSLENSENTMERGDKMKSAKKPHYCKPTGKSSKRWPIRWSPGGCKQWPSRSNSPLDTRASWQFPQLKERLPCWSGRKPIGFWCRLGPPKSQGILLWQFGLTCRLDTSKYSRLEGRNSLFFLLKLPGPSHSPLAPFQRWSWRFPTCIPVWQIAKIPKISLIKGETYFLHLQSEIRNTGVFSEAVAHGFVILDWLSFYLSSNKP